MSYLILPLIYLILPGFVFYLIYNGACVTPEDCKDDPWYGEKENEST